jgi:hypothetical protein
MKIYLLFCFFIILAISSIFLIDAKNKSNSKPIGINTKEHKSYFYNKSLFLLLPENWINKKFFVLKKPPMFQKFGYELYITPNLSFEKSSLDTSIVLSNKKVRYHILAGKILTVIDVTKTNNEYQVTFLDEPENKKYFAKTINGSIEGLMLLADLDSAILKWKDKIIFSRRRFIDTYDTISGNYGKIKVRIQEPLKVLSIKAGLTPLPPKPIWIYVETSLKEKGFIPIRQSWTNVSVSEIKNNLPWEDDLFDINPATIFSWDSII